MTLNTRQKKAIEAVIEIGSEPSGELPATELARRLEVSKESVHQLLLPLVRAGLVVAVRGRAGGYRAAEGLRQASIASVTASFEAPRAGAAARFAAIDELEERAEGARQAVYEGQTVGQLVARARAERSVVSWDI